MPTDLPPVEHTSGAVSPPQSPPQSPQIVYPLKENWMARTLKHIYPQAESKSAKRARDWSSVFDFQEAPPDQEASFSRNSAKANADYGASPLKLMLNMDPYQNRPKTPKLFSGFFHVLVILPAIVIYAMFTLAHCVKESRKVSCTNNVVWTLYAEPLPLQIECLAPSGCWISSSYENDNICATHIPASEQGCAFVEHHHRQTFHVCYSSVAEWGMVALWHSNDTEYGLATVSQMIMPDSSLMDTKVKISHGTFKTVVVNTQNFSLPLEDENRFEYFSDMKHREVYVRESACLPELPQATQQAIQNDPQQIQRGYPNQGQYSAANIPLESFYFFIECNTLSSWYTTFLGAVGGFISLAYSAGRIFTQAVNTRFQCKQLYDCFSGN
ncbi:hypothetical protein CYMTET_22282 [Cymbomonas tetramitiformis]|uniref:Uncharacterized protein n=1 Tax=Cymbomonas tetramitiformis TaxID=36881 RepID=A0AAE0C3H5_9CHLO|nr:hypothetical protein CYMTET_42783 [Cymbomonas tetramitiformis]KAK3269270.1 hypothetical protein CYMTET_22282 [Cymbomonas tetramitiformis]